MKVRQEHGNPQPSLDSLYQQLWKVEAAPKIWHFLWKCVNNSVAVARNLAYRHMSREASCPRCSSQEETINHLLYTCPFARLVWAVSPVPTSCEGGWSESIYANIYRTINLRQENKDWGELERITPWLLWRLWKNRNELVFKGKEYGAIQVVEKAQEDALDWSRRQRETQGMSILHTRRIQVANWTKPPDTWKKCNSDGAWRKESERSGIGWVLRNQEGRVLWMGARAVSKLGSAWETEATSLRWAILSTLRLSFEKVIFETDAEELVTRILEKSNSSNTHPLIQDIRDLLSKFNNVKVVFTYREGNKVADKIAKVALEAMYFVPRLYTVVPVWLRNLVLKDSCNLIMG